MRIQQRSLNLAKGLTGKVLLKMTITNLLRKLTEKIWR